jgi:dTDP-4-amino-4,6-dideoxygalactose transaminase
MSIPLCDLESENAPMANDLRAAFARVLASGRFVLGPEVLAFERELAEAVGVAHAVGTSSGTDALLSLLLASGIGGGDEVITTPYSFFATAEAIVRAGATPVFADVDVETLNLDPEQALWRLGPRTRAVVVVHLFGAGADTAPLARPCRDAGVVILEDAAQAMGLPALARTAGAALSFQPSKNLGGFGDGGMVLTPDPQIAARVRRLRVHGASDTFHHVLLGGNFRLDEVQAALLRVKLPQMSRWNEARRRIAASYLERLAGLGLRLPSARGESVWSRFVVRVPDGRRDALANHLRERGVATAVYYPKPLHLQPALAGLGGRPGQLPVAERAAEEALALPIHPTLSETDLDRICDAVRSFVSS